MSLNKGSLDKANQNQKLDIEYLFVDFVAGENIAANQIVMASGAADNTVLIATADCSDMVVGVAINDALITETVKVVIYGVIDIIAGENLSRSYRVKTGATAGRAYEADYIISEPGTAHNHALSVTSGAPSDTVADVLRGLTMDSDFCADTSGGEVTKEFDSILGHTIISVAEPTHTHDITDPTANESAHDHELWQDGILGVMLEGPTTGNKGKCLVTLA